MDEDQLKGLQAQLRALHRSGRSSTPSVDGVSRVASRTLGAIARRGGETGVGPGEIADELGMTSSNVAAALRELEAAGYIARKRADLDARQVVVRLTERGTEAVRIHRSLKADALREAIESALDPAEQAQVAAVIPLLERVVAGYRTGVAR